MIGKELDPFSDTSDPLLRAGRASEEQMAFYLRRAFGSAPDVRVFHGLRLERAGDAAQIDHLLLHRWGMILIESKSVTTRVRVNAQGEWMRWYSGRWTGMPSPALQVERQAAFLRARLREHAEELLDKMLGQQVRFGKMPLDTFVAISDQVDTFVAISDQGIIERPKGAWPQVCKADQVAGQITVLLEAYRKANGPLGLLRGEERFFWHTFKAEETTRVMQFLRHAHCPLHRASTSQAFQVLPDDTGETPQRDKDFKETAAPSLSSLPPPGRKPPTLEAVRVNIGPVGDDCAVCGKAVTAGVARYCREHSARFGGRVYCMEYQRRKP